jgi:hypothetical protein
MEAFLESYHEIATHPQLLEWNSDANTQYNVWDRVNRLFTLIGVPSPHLGKVDDDAVYEAALGFYSAPGVTDPPSELPAGTGAREAIAQLARNMVTGAVGVDTSAESISTVLDAVQYWVFPNWCRGRRWPTRCSTDSGRTATTRTPPSSMSGSCFRRRRAAHGPPQSGPAMRSPETMVSVRRGPVDHQRWSNRSESGPRVNGAAAPWAMRNSKVRADTRRTTPASASWFRTCHAGVSVGRVNEVTM